MRNQNFYEKYRIQVVQRTIQILDVLLAARGALSLDEISQRTRMPRSTVFRIITNLLEHGYITETSDGYWLGLKMISLGAAVEDRLDLRRQALPHMRALREQSGETVYLAALSGDMQVIYLEKLESVQSVGVVMANVGMVAAPHCTALGKTLAAHQPVEQVRAWLQTAQLPAHTANTITSPDVLLAELETVRQRGYATDDQENEEGIRCIAAPVRNSRGEVIAAISVAGPAQRMPAHLSGSPLAAHTVAAACEISAALGLNHRSPEHSEQRSVYALTPLE